MSKNYLILLALFFLGTTGWGQTARLQLIHNSPSPTVDIYVNGVLLQDDFAFRTATPFADVPAGVSLDIAVAPDTSTSAASAIAVFEGVVLTEGGTFVVTAGGVVGDPDTPFTLFTNPVAQETAAMAGMVDLAVLHGSPNAPSVAVDARGIGEIIPSLSYGEYTDYLSVPPGVYYFDVRAEGSTDVVATFEADLSGLAGGAATVFASGFLGGDPAFGLFAALPDGSVIELPAVNIPDLVINEVDYDQPGEDDGEFIEIKNMGDEPASLENISLELVNGNNNETYELTELEGTIEAGGYFVVCYGENNANYCDLRVPEAIIQNGDPDAVALNYNSLILDALSYEGDVPGFTEGSGAGLEDISSDPYAGLSRIPDGADTDMNNMDFAFVCATPGAANVDQADGCQALARLQLIHNSPSPTVDIYVNGALLEDDFAYRTARPFIDVPANVELDIAVAPDTSTSAASALVVFQDVVFDDNLTYVAAAGGIVGDDATPFTLQVNDAAKEAADDPATVEVSVLHGSTDAPAVDVDARAVGTIIEGLAYGNYTEDYLVLPPDLFYLDVRAAGDPNIVATFEADLSGLAGQAVTVFASGLLNGDPGFGLFAALANGEVVELPATEVARVQLIHNSPSPTVDIYANGALLEDDFAFRTATPFTFLPAGVEIDVAVAPDTSTSAASAIAVFEDIVFVNGETYVVTAGGVVGDAETPFELQVNAMAKERADDPAAVEVAVLHGSPDAPAVDVDARAVGTIIENLEYGNYTDGYLVLEDIVYYLDVRAAGDPNIVATFEADLSDLDGQAVTVFASGFLNDAPGFGLFAALPNGDVVELPAAEVARVQIIHNSPSPTVDIYANGERLLDDFEFQTATPFDFLPAGVGIDIAVALADSETADDAIVVFEDVTFENGLTYIVVANGIVGDADNPFELVVSDIGQERAASGEGIDVLAFHGSPGAPAVDISDFLAPNLISNLAYGEFQGYANIPDDQYFLEVRPAGAEELVGTFFIDLEDLDGAAAVVFASGIVDGDPDFNLLAALPDGQVVEFLPVALAQIFHNSPAAAASTIDLWAANLGIILEDDLSYRSATPITFFPARFPFIFGVAPADSDDPGDILFTVPELTFDEKDRYFIVANGIPGDDTTPFELDVNTGYRFNAAETDQVDLAVFHGSQNAPAVDVTARGVAQLVDGLAYGEFEPYFSVPADNYFLEIRPDGSDDLVATFGADLIGAEGVAGVVVASGLLGDEPNFGLFLVLADGQVLPLPTFARAQVIHNSPDPTVDIFINGGDQPAIPDFEFRTATPFLDLPTREELDIQVNVAGTNTVVDNFPVTLEDGKTYIIIATGIAGDGTTPFELAVFDEGRERALNDTDADLLFYHGATDAPEVDVVVDGGGVLFDNTSYGAFNGYASVPPAEYVLNVTPADDNNTIVRKYSAEEVATLEGAAATVFATGFLSGDDPAFGVWVALPNGDTFPLDDVTSTDDLNGLVSDFQLAPNPARTTTRLQYTLEERMDNVTFQLFDAYGSLVRSDYRGQLPAGDFSQDLEVSDLAAGVYYFSLTTDKGSLSRRLVVVK